MASSTFSLHSIASLVLLFLTPSIVNGWVTSPSCRSPRSLIVDTENSVCQQRIASSRSTAIMMASTQEDEEIIEYLDEDEDDDESGADYDPEAAIEQQAEWMEELLHLSKATSIDPTAVESAQAIFDAMFQTYVETDDSTFFPNAAIYNLLLETHGYSRTDSGAEEAEGILDKMMDPSNDFVAKPNEESFMCVMDAWAIRKQPEKAKEVLEKQDEPSIESYNKLIKAYGMAGDFEAAESLFRSLLTDGNANQKSWVQIMKAALSQDDYEDEEEGSLVESYFDEMEEEGFEPETDAYNVLIRSIGKEPNGFSKTEGILFQMIADYREGDETKKPNVGTFRALLTTYHKQGPKKLATASSAAKVEQLLQFMDGLVTQEEKEMQFPDTAVAYRMALDVIGWSKDPKKAAKAQRILQKHPQPSLDVYIAVLKACASTQGNSQGKFEAFQIATSTLKELRAAEDEESYGLTSSTMGLFLQSCNRLMPSGPKRDEIVTKVFRECAERGLVNDFVLEEFEGVTSEDIQLEVLGGFLVDGVSIPESWSRNVASP